MGGIDGLEVTVAVPVSDLERAQAWYEALLGRDAPDLVPVEGVVEYRVAGAWLQLRRGQVGESGWNLRLGVPDVRRERARLAALGFAPGELRDVPGVVRTFDLRDPDRNRVSLYTVLAPDRSDA